MYSQCKAQHIAGVQLWFVVDVVLFQRELAPLRKLLSWIVCRVSTVPNAKLTRKQ